MLLFFSALSIYTSTCPFSLEGEGWDEGDISGCFYSPHPNSLQQERELGRLVTHWVYNAKSCVVTYGLKEGVLRAN
jgi:hypothetical protein